MPIYEFYCSHCHRVFNFLSRRVDTEKRPSCPRCGAELARRPSAFAISKGRKEPASAGPEGMPDVDDARLERAMESLAGELEHVDESDPRGSARLMRRLFEATGLPISGPMAEAIRRMEAGEDPDKIEEEMGDALGEDPFAAAGAAAEPAGPGLKGLRRRLLPPSVDTTLYEM